MDKKSPLNLKSVTPAPGLLPRVLAVIHDKQYRARLIRIRAFAITAGISIVALVPVGINLIKAWAASNIDTYISLLFSDGITYWKLIGASLVESLPVVSLMLTLALLGILLWSVRIMVRFIDANTPRFI